MSVTKINYYGEFPWEDGDIVIHCGRAYTYSRPNPTRTAGVHCNHEDAPDVTDEQKKYARDREHARKRARSQFFRDAGLP